MNTQWIPSVSAPGENKGTRNLPAPISPNRGNPRAPETPTSLPKAAPYIALHHCTVCHVAARVPPKGALRYFDGPHDLSGHYTLSITDVRMCFLDARQPREGGDALLSLVWHCFLMHMHHCLAISLVLDVHAVNLVSVHIITAYYHADTCTSVISAQRQPHLSLSDHTARSCCTT